MLFPVFVDANALIPIHLTDLLLRLAEAGTYRPLWSEQVLDEVERNLPRVGVTPTKAQRRVQVMRDAFPDAVVTDYEPLIDAMTNDPKDHHVLAAAVRANAEIIVTNNLRGDFPAQACAPYDIRAVSPDEFLLDQFDLYRDQTVRCVQDMVGDLRRPPMTCLGFLSEFRKTVPNFVDEISPTMRRL